MGGQGATSIAAMPPRPVIVPAPLPGFAFRDLPGRIRANGAARPDAPALIEGDAVTSWGDLAGAMDRIAAHLSARGVAPGDAVASLGGVTADHVALYLGVLAAGACMAPLPTSARPETIAAMIANCAPALIFADASGAEAAADVASDPLDGLIGRTAGLRPGPPRAPAEADAFDIIYSSGTTGSPKGIVHDHLFRARQAVRFASYGFDAAISLVSTPIYSNTTLAALLPALAGGGTIVLMGRFDAGRFLALAERHRVTHAMLVPVQYRRILDHPGFDAADLSSFRVKLSTSAPFPAPMLREALGRWPGRMVNMYGMTEGGVGCMLDAGAHPGKLHTVGRPVAGCELRILDGDGRAGPPGAFGEVVGRSATMMTGYLGDPERTRAALWRSPEGEAFVRSGDVGRIDEDGFLVLMDRAKDMVNSGGFNVFPADLEAVLSAHPLVAEVAVIAVPSAEWGETPLALVVPRGPADPEALRGWANARLGRTQRIAAVELREALPRSEIGKVLKRELRAPYWPDRP